MWNLEGPQNWLTKVEKSGVILKIDNSVGERVSEWVYLASAWGAFYLRSQVSLGRVNAHAPTSLSDWAANIANCDDANRMPYVRFKISAKPWGYMIETVLDVNIIALTLLERVNRMGHVKSWCVRFVISPRIWRQGTELLDQILALRIGLLVLRAKGFIC